MANTQQYLEVLRELGLDKYEAQACVALYTHGPLTSRELAQHSHVPKSWIYSVLKSLAEKGWVETTQGRPRIYKPVPLATLLPRIRKQLSERVERSVALIEELGSKGVEASEAISALLYYGEEQVAAKASQLLSESPRSTLVLNQHWARIIRPPAEAKTYTWAKPYGLLVLRDSVFWFLGGDGLPVMGVLAYSKSLTVTLEEFIARQLRLGRLRPLEPPPRRASG